jgi:hypothetical protein
MRGARLLLVLYSSLFLLHGFLPERLEKAVRLGQVVLLLEKFPTNQL